MKTLLYLVLLLLCLLAGFAVLNDRLEGTGPIRFDPFITDPPCAAPSSSLTLRNAQDLNQDPLFRAGTIALYSEYYLGHGFLVTDGARLYFHTAEHVADIAQGACAYLSIPGASFTILARFSQFIFTGGHQWEADERASFELTGELYDRVSRLITSGHLVPLSISRNVPARGEPVAIPNYETGAYSVYFVYQSDSQYLSLTTNGQAGLICGGRSGSPVLLLSGNQVTSQVVAVISSIDSTTVVETADGNHCGYIAYALRF